MAYIHFETITGDDDLTLLLKQQSQFGLKKKGGFPSLKMIVSPTAILTFKMSA